MARDRFQFSVETSKVGFLRKLFPRDSLIIGSAMSAINVNELQLKLSKVVDIVFDNLFE